MLEREGEVPLTILPVVLRGPRWLLVLPVGLFALSTGSVADRTDVGAVKAARNQAQPPAAQRVVARGVTGYYDLGDYRVYGEVANNLDVPVYDVRLSVTFRNAAGKIVATGEAAPTLDRIEPRSTSPFADLQYGAPSGIVSRTVTVEGYSLKGPLNYQPVTILSAAKRSGILGEVVSGRGRNGATRPLSSIVLVASFRDRAGTVVSVVYDYPVLGSLQPGQEFEYTIETFDDSLADTRVLVQGQGRTGP